MRRAPGTLLALLSLSWQGVAFAQAAAQPTAAPDAPKTEPSPPSGSSAPGISAPDTSAPDTSAPNTSVTPPPAAPAPSAAPPVPSDATGAKATGEPAKPGTTLREKRPTPLVVDYAQYGLGLGGDINLTSGRICPPGAFTPCILGSGGGLAIRGGYRPSGPWYIGGAYQFAKLDSNNLFRLGIFQQLRGEMRYYVDFGSRITPYVQWGLGGAIYGNEWGASTGGAVALAGGGAEFEITRFALVGVDMAYEPVLLAGYTDSTGQKRDTGISQFLRLELTVELRTELGRE